MISVTRDVPRFGSFDSAMRTKDHEKIRKKIGELNKVDHKTALPAVATCALLLPFFLI